MKTTRKKFFGIANIIIVGFLSILGFSCSSDDEENESNFVPGMVEYGTPTATFVIKGKVVNESGNRLTGIRIITKSSAPFKNNNDYFAFADTFYSDKKGNFSYIRERAPLNNYLIPIISEDVSGMYARDSSNVDFKSAKFEDSEHFWFKGTAEKETTITLKKSNKK